MFSLDAQHKEPELYERRLTIAGLVETVPRITMRCEDSDLVAARLEANSGINDQPLSTANAQVRVEEDDALLFCHC